MTQPRFLTLLTCFAIGLLGLAGAAHALYCPYEIVSVSSQGEQANEGSVGGAVSADGRFVAFMSRATNLVPDDANGKWDVFVRDRQLQTTEIASISTSGAQGNADSGAGQYYYSDWLGIAISADGRFVAFISVATNLVADDTNGKADVFVRDRLNGTTERISISSAGVQGDASSGSPSINADGSLAAFRSDATNLAPADTNGVSDVFVHNRAAGTTERVSVSTSGQQGDGESYSPSMSASGSLVVFLSGATNLVPGQTALPERVLLRDRDAATTEAIPLPEGHACWYHEAQISGDGRFVAFSCCSLYLYDRQTGTREVIGECAWTDTGVSYFTPTISTDGRYLCYDRMFWVYGPPAPPLGSASCTHLPVIVEAPHQKLPQSVWQSFVETYMYFAETGESVALRGGDDTIRPELSADGRFVAFSTGSGSCPSPSQVYILETPDIESPDTQIVGGPCGETVCSSSVTVSWGGSDDHTPPESLQFAWRLDSGAWSAWTTETSTALTGLSDGAHAFEVKARDLDWNEDATPARCEFTVAASAPHVSITSPADGATVRGTMGITADASPAAAIQHVEFYVNDQLLCTDTTVPYTCEWDTTRTVPLSERRGAVPLLPSLQRAEQRSAPTNGPARICAKAFDTCGRSYEHCINVTVRNQTFADVPPENPAFPYVEAMAAAGITNGCLSAQTPDGLPLFCPYSSVTRAQLAALICRAAGKTPLDRATPTFADVPKTSPYYGWIERFCDPDSWNGSAPGGPCNFYGPKKFCPNSAVTREQIAPVLCRATAKSPMPTCSGTFADVASGSPFCPYIERLADPSSWGGTAVTVGCAVGPPRLYCPKANITRGQMAVFLVRAFGITL